MKCSRPRCTRTLRTNGLCFAHWKQSIAQGLHGYTDSDTVREHLARLRSLQWPHVGIAHTAGVSTSTLYHALAAPRIQRANERAILSVPLVLYGAYKVSLPAAGLQRRREALACMGWPLETVAKLAWTSPQAVCNAQRRGRVPVSVHERFAKVYDELHNTPGPSRFVAARARTKGYFPAVAWECVDIDDPDIWPNLTGYEEETVRALIEGFQPEYEKQDLDEAIRRTSFLTTEEQAKLFGLAKHVVHERREEEA